MTNNGKRCQFDAYSKTKCFSARIQKQRQLRPPTQKPSQQMSTLNPVIADPRKKNNPIAIAALKRSQFRSIHENQRIIGPSTATKSFSTRGIKKSTSTSKLKTINCEPSHKKQVNLEPITEINLISIPALVSSWFRCLYAWIKSRSSRHCKHAIFDREHYTQFSFISPLKSSLVWLPQTEINSISTTHTKKSQFFPCSH